MKTKTIIGWIFFLIIIDQIIKIIINTYFLETEFNIIPTILEFKPTFNGHHSWVNSMLYNKFQINIGLLPHIILFILIEIIILAIYFFYKKNIYFHTKLLDIALIFQLTGAICAFIGNLIWEKGTLDYIYLKPLFVFDLKDVYINCSVVLFIVFFEKNRNQIKNVKMRDFFSHVKGLFNRQENM